MKDEPLAATINSLMDFLKIHTAAEKDVAVMYGEFRKLTNKPNWTFDDEKQAHAVICRAIEKVDEIKLRRSFYYGEDKKE